jgi:three-Cys-motif partner protein
MYKDLILDYYLVPYLAKVRRIGKPILIVDCFAGPGRFGDGQPGSPLIISKRLREVHERGAEVLGLYIEKDPILYKQLEEHMRDSPVPVRTRLGDFRDYLDEMTGLAKDHTVFVYLDPIKPSDLLFDDMASVYGQLKEGGSVETLINFMSASFIRAVSGFGKHIIQDRVLQTDQQSVVEWNNVAGGRYWQEIIFGCGASDTDWADRLANGYASKLHRWFDWVINFPIRAKYEHSPKYHLVFGSSHPDGIELMNRAMVKARRELVEFEFVVGRLFPDEPENEVIDLGKVKRIVVETANQKGKMTWKWLRVYATIAHSGKYNDTDFNRAIKELIRDGQLGSECPGKKIEQKALIWPLS